MQHLDGDYGMYTWPCAPVLAQYVYSKREFIKSKKVLEVSLVHTYSTVCMQVCKRWTGAYTRSLKAPTPLFIIRTSTIMMVAYAVIIIETKRTLQQVLM